MTQKNPTDLSGGLNVKWDVLRIETLTVTGKPLDVVTESCTTYVIWDLMPGCPGKKKMRKSYSMWSFKCDWITLKNITTQSPSSTWGHDLSYGKASIEKWNIFIYDVQGVH